MVEILTADDAMMAKDRVVDVSRLRHRAGMRGGSAPSGGRATHLGDDQRLARLGGLLGDGAEPVRPTNAFEIEQKNVDAAFVEPPIDIVGRFEDRLVAGADLMREAQLLIAATAQKRKGQRPALAADGDRP